MKGLYLLALVISISGITFIDYRLRLAFFKYPKRTIKILLFAITMFILWDVAGIRLQIFFIGTNGVLVGVRIGQFPLEEIFFLALLNYCSLISYLLIKQRVKS